MTRSARLASSAILVITLSASACASSPQNGTLPSGVGVTRIQVTNQNWADMRIYVVRSGTRFRLGSVPSMTTQVFVLPRSLSSTASGMQLLAHPMGSREMHLTPMLHLMQGQLVRFTVENHLAISSVSVF